MFKWFWTIFSLGAPDYWTLKTVSGVIKVTSSWWPLLYGHRSVSNTNTSLCPFDVRITERGSTVIKSGADPGFFLGGGALVSSNKPHSFFCRIPVVLENRRSSGGGGGGAPPPPPPVPGGGGGGGAHPLHPPPRSAPESTRNTLL